MKIQLVTRIWRTSLIFLVLTNLRCSRKCSGCRHWQHSGHHRRSDGAIIQSSSVTLTDTATGVQRKTVSGVDGLYSFPNIPVGVYNLDVLAQGFTHYTQANIVLEVGSSISVNVNLTVGSASQKVEVQASGIALQTEDATFKQTIDQRTITEMPLNGRQMTNLITLSGGSSAAPGGDFTGSKYSYQTIAVSIHS